MKQIGNSANVPSHKLKSQIVELCYNGATLLEGYRYLAAIHPTTGRGIFVVDGVQDRPVFKAMVEEAKQAGINHIRFEVYGCLQTYSGPKVFFSKFDDLGLSGLDLKVVGPHQKVEYDRAYFGGDYSGVGEFVFIPESVIEQLGSVQAAFLEVTGIPAHHIINTYDDERFTSDGGVWADEAEDGKSGQDRASYSDDQDRHNYSVENPEEDGTSSTDLPAFATDLDQQYRYRVPVNSKLVQFLPKTDFRPEAMRVTRRESSEAVWFEVETYNEASAHWIQQKDHSTEELALQDAIGWYPDPAAKVSQSDERPAYKHGQVFVFKPGDPIIGNGYKGTVVRMYSEGMVEVRLPGGTCCIPASYPDCYPASETK